MNSMLQDIDNIPVAFAESVYIKKECTNPEGKDYCNHDLHKTDVSVSSENGNPERKGSHSYQQYLTECRSSKNCEEEMQGKHDKSLEKKNDDTNKNTLKPFLQKLVDNPEDEPSCSKENLNKSKYLTTSFEMEPISVIVTENDDPFLWDLKYASRIVDYVVKHCAKNYSVRIRWHPEDYDSFTGACNIEFGSVDKWRMSDTLRDHEISFYHKFWTLINPQSYVNQSIFDAAVEVIYEEHLSLYYTDYLNYQLAAGIALFALYSSQYGFPDALYHAVHVILSNVKALKKNNYTIPCNNLVSIYRGSSLVTFDMYFKLKWKPIMII